MREYENQCVGCPPEMGCIGEACPHINVPIDYCDQCHNYAEYRIDGDDLCEKCADKYLNDIFNDLSVSEKAEALEIELENIND